MSHAETSSVAVTVYTAGADTGGAWSLVELTLSRYAVGPPLHIHAQTTERLTVLQGLLVCTLGTRTSTLWRVRVASARCWNAGSPI
jgi:hypothetical protein